MASVFCKPTAHVHTYVRVSTYEQASAAHSGPDACNSSLDAQRAMCADTARQIVVARNNNAAVRYNYAIGREFADVHSAFGDNHAKRIGWAEMRAYINSGDMIVISRADRAGRSIHTIAELDQFIYNNIDIYIIECAAYYSDCRDVTYRLIMQAIAESSAISARARANARFQSEVGGHVGRIPFGFQTELAPNGGRRRVPNPDIHRIVRNATEELKVSHLMTGMMNPDLPPLAPADIIQHITACLSSAGFANIGKPAIMRIIADTVGACSVCHIESDDTIVCRWCFDRYHWYCIAEHTHTPTSAWYCPACVIAENAPHLACQCCDRTTSTRVNPIMICSQCSLGFHSDCIHEPNTDSLNWLCQYCYSR